MGDFDLAGLITKTRPSKERVHRTGYRMGYQAAVRDMRQLLGRRERIVDALERCFLHGRDTLSDWEHGPEGAVPPPRLIRGN